MPNEQFCGTSRNQTREAPFIHRRCRRRSHAQHVANDWINRTNKQVVKVMRHKAASTPRMDRSVVFVRWCHYAPPSNTWYEQRTTVVKWHYVHNINIVNISVATERNCSICMQLTNLSKATARLTWMGFYVVRRVGRLREIGFLFIDNFVRRKSYRKNDETKPINKSSTGMLDL